MMKNDAVIFDIDGTLAKMGDRSPYEWSKVGLDTPHKDIIQLTTFFKEKLGYKVIVVTGRLEVCRDETMQWLHDNDVAYDELYMREANEEFEKDYVIKTRIFMDEIKPKYNVEYIFDDRDQTVARWRAMGLRCLQVAEGKF